MLSGTMLSLSVVVRVFLGASDLTEVPFASGGWATGLQREASHRG